MNMRYLLILMLAMLAAPAWAQDEPVGEETTAPEAATSDSERQEAQPTFADVTQTVQRQLEQAEAELSALRERIAEEKIPLSRRLSELESELVNVRQEFQKTNNRLNNRTLELENLRKSIEARENEARYLTNLLTEYIRNLEPRLHIAETQRYEQQVEEARLAPENTNLTQKEIFQEQIEAVNLSVERLFEALGGVTFEGQAKAPDGEIKPGKFLMAGPVVLFRSVDGSVVGTVEESINSLQPNVKPFKDPRYTSAADTVVEQGKGSLPLDATLGNAHAIEDTQDTFYEHVQKGGPVMVPIFVMAGLALLVALYKWIALSLIRNPSQRKLRMLLDAVARREKADAMQAARNVSGPAGKMLESGIEHIEEPRELIEEIMYEHVLAARLKVNRFLPFISICAAAAPLLGLLGTVTGIINTFEMITIFGTGDAESLSGGISEALITTKFGLIVAIPSLLLYAFLSRKARGIIDGMEKAAVALVNQVGKTPYKPLDEAA